MKLGAMQAIFREHTLRCDDYAIGPTLSTERIFFAREALARRKWVKRLYELNRKREMAVSRRVERIVLIQIMSPPSRMHRGLTVREDTDSEDSARQ